MSRIRWRRPALRSSFNVWSACNFAAASLEGTGVDCAVAAGKRRRFGLRRAAAICGEPRSAEAIAAALHWANAHQAAVAARGGGSKMEWGHRPRHLNLVVSTGNLTQVVEHAFDDMTATVEPGCTFADFQRHLALHGQRLALDPLFPERATIGGVLATNDSGALRLRYGSLRDLIIGITVALPDGTLARSGGK